MKNRKRNSIYWNSMSPDTLESDIQDFASEIQNSTMNVDVVNNHIYFYATINTENIAKLNKHIMLLSANMMARANEYSIEPPAIYLHINSDGGGIFDGFAGMDAILKCKTPIITVIDGCCASAGTFLSLAGSHRQMNKHAHILIHQLSSGFWGKYGEIKDEMKNLNKFMDMMRAVYIEKTKLSEEKINEILEHDIWFTAEEALNYGLIDEII